MRRIIVFFVITSSLLFSLGEMPKSWNESFEVEKVFKDYQKALLNDNGN